MDEDFMNEIEHSEGERAAANLAAAIKKPSVAAMKAGQAIFDLGRNYENYGPAELAELIDRETGLSELVKTIERQQYELDQYLQKPPKVLWKGWRELRAECDALKEQIRTLNKGRSNE